MSFVGNHAFTSPDGSNWIVRGQVTTARPNKAARGNGLFIVGGHNKAEYSSNGDSWTTIPNLCCFSAQDYSFAFGNGFFVTCDEQGIKKSDPIVTLQMDGPSSLRFLSPTGAVVSVESSSLASGESWQLVTNLLLPTSPYLWIAPPLSNSPSRFYRAHLVP